MQQLRERRVRGQVAGQAVDETHGLEVVAAGAKTIWVQLGIWNQDAAYYGEEQGLTVVMDRCIKVEHARFHGGLHLLGFDTGQISSKKLAR